MRIIVFSDVHGNLESLIEVSEEIRRLGADLVVSLGDVVGYGARPAECIELVREVADIKVSGNHDFVAAGLAPASSFNSAARDAIEWTADQLNENQIEYLRSYQPIVHHSRCLFVHASPLSPLDWPYITTLTQSREVIRQTEEKFIFIGHTHIPAVISSNRNGLARYLFETPVRIEEGHRYLVNTGSVGQPRDGINKASFTLLDTDRGIIDQRRVDYDFRAAKEDIIHAGLPGKLAVRLETGE